MGKLSNLEMVEVVGFLCPQNEKIGFSLRKLREGLVQEKEEEVLFFSLFFLFLFFFSPLFSSFLLFTSLFPSLFEGD